MLLLQSSIANPANAEIFAQTRWLENIILQISFPRNPIKFLPIITVTTGYKR